MLIAVNNVYSKVLTCSDAEDALLEKLLCVSVPGHEYMSAFKRKVWDGKKRFYSTNSKVFPTGFLPFIMEEATKKKMIVETRDDRKVPALSDPMSIKKKYSHLREYQLDGLHKILTYTIRSENQVLPWSRGIVKFPTGSGKTLLAASLADFIGKKTLYVVERRELMYQTQDAFKTQTDMTLGFFGDNHYDFEADITFGMAQTIHSFFGGSEAYIKSVQAFEKKHDVEISKEVMRENIRLFEARKKVLLAFLASRAVLIIDESQHMAQGNYHRISAKCPAPFRYGFSATPLKRGDLGDVYLIGDTGEIIAEGDREEITTQGFLAKPEIYIFTVRDPKVEKISYKQAYRSLIIENDYRNEMILGAVKKLLARGCSILILVREIAHGQLLDRMVKKAKIPCLFIKGADSMAVRKQAKEEIGKSYHVLISTGIFDEGIDLPELGAAILAGGGRSRIKSIQRVGRTLRPKNDGKNKVYIVDFKDLTNQYLMRHSAERLAAYEEEKFNLHFPDKV